MSAEWKTEVGTVVGDKCEGTVILSKHRAGPFHKLVITDDHGNKVRFSSNEIKTLVMAIDDVRECMDRG